MRVKKLLYLLSVILAAAFIHLHAEEENRGEPEMVLKGGKSGDVSFPHSRHQNVLGDCGKCHELFPKKSGSIEDLLKEGKLAKKQVMNHCRDCHREMKKAGKAAGPTGCSKCHNKS